MKNLFFPFILAILVLFANNANSQTYNSAVGARLGYGLNATYKKFISDNKAVELSAGTYGGYYYGGLYVAGLLQFHNAISDMDNLLWYYGGGVGAAFFSYDTRVGLVLNLGLDYSFDDIPLNVSLDISPAIWFTGTTRYGYRSGGLAIRYILK